MQQVEKGEIDISLSNLIKVSDELNVNLEQLLAFSSQLVFNNCTQTGNTGSFHNCIFNDPKIADRLDKLMKKL